MVPNPVTKPLQVGRSYTVDELLHQMIVYSDNVATHRLANFVDFTILSKTYSDLGIVNPYYRSGGPLGVVASAEYRISVHSYASFFRILFNASYLSKTMSEKALSLLADTEFKNGIEAGVPPTIKVAHKWGVHVAGARGEQKQLHDCGIVYYPEHPYLLCVMTSGTSLDYLDLAIASVSRSVFENIDRQRRR